MELDLGVRRAGPLLQETRVDMVAEAVLRIGENAEQP